MLLHAYLDRVGAAGVFATLTGGPARRYDDLAVLTTATLAFALGVDTVEGTKHLRRAEAGATVGLGASRSCAPCASGCPRWRRGAIRWRCSAPSPPPCSPPTRPVTRFTSSTTISCPTPARSRWPRGGTPSAGTPSPAGPTRWSPTRAPARLLRRRRAGGTFRHDARVLAQLREVTGPAAPVGQPVHA